VTTVLVTGSFGNVGSYVVRRLLKLHYDVIAYDLRTPATEKVSHQFKTVTPYWGDITDGESLQRVFENEHIDSIIHLAFKIPPFTEKQPDVAEKVNVGGTETLINTSMHARFQGPVVFSSSVSVFGITNKETPPVTVNHPVQATDTYTRHKLQCETLFKKSTLDWRILRYSGVVAPGGLSSTDQLEVAFRIPLATRVEPVHVKDVATATVNALVKDEASKTVFIIAGGLENQVYWKHFFVKALEPFIGRVTPDDLPSEKFSKEPYYLDWYDTAESQQVLQYQHHTIDDYVQDIYDTLGVKRVLFRFLRPFIRKKILS
jgi:nucleoside-diphosphate-sugar epimerase